jgi:hypothetical protein
LEPLLNWKSKLIQLGYNWKGKDDLGQIKWDWKISKSKDCNENKECLSEFLLQSISILEPFNLVQFD